MVWSNWGRNQTASPAAVAHPRGADEIAEVVTGAARAGRRVKPVGSGHSFTGIALTDGVQVQLDRHADLIDADLRTGVVTVRAGMPLHRLNATLADLGLALTNLGDIDRQTISGALATGTHGTGAQFGGLATQVRAMEIVLSDGSTVNCSADERPDLFAAARIGLGAFGIVSTITLQAEPLYLLRAREFRSPLDQTLDRFDEWAESTDHVEFYWFPHTRWTLVKRNDRLPLDSGAHPLQRWRSWLDDELLSNTVFGATIALGNRAPGLIRPINRIAARALSDREYTDLSHRVFCSPRRVRFVEMEYAVPRPQLLPLITELDRALDRADLRIPFPVEVRVAAADDIPLSTASGRDSGYLAVHLPAGADTTRYFRLVESLATAVDGRPHWGKQHTLGVRELRPRYPAYDDIVKLRRAVDPSGVFANDYLDRVFGPIA